MVLGKKTKKLDKDVATSILVSTELLRQCNQLQLITSNRDNEYYHVRGTNIVIAHIEEGFNILVDYMVTTVTKPEELQSLPHMLSSFHFGVYQKKGDTGGYRDWIANSANNMQVGYIIKFIIHGEGCKFDKQSLDHKSETFNELDVNTEFTYNNPNGGSHRRRIDLNTMENLLQFIEAIRKYEKKGGYGFIFKKK